MLPGYTATIYSASSGARFHEKEGAADVDGSVVAAPH